MAELIAPGDVWLVGAGPGDPDLLTRKAEKLIAAASVVFHDALVGPGVLDLIPPTARRVPVGKRSGRHSRTQDTINALLVKAALAGERVVRLKGGDPSIFGRSAEEIDALARHGVRARICPGITAASAAAASACVSLSLRGSARQVRFVTAQARADEAIDLDWSALADPGATLAFYMGRAAAPEICRNLIAHGLPATTPVLIAKDVSLAEERLVHTRLDLLPIAIGNATGGPALILIGEAVRARRASDPGMIADVLSGISFPPRAA
jgi:uroporphyrin-III C-methyltransferase